MYECSVSNVNHAVAVNIGKFKLFLAKQFEPSKVILDRGAVCDADPAVLVNVSNGIKTNIVNIRRGEFFVIISDTYLVPAFFLP